MYRPWGSLYSAFAEDVRRPCIAGALPYRAIHHPWKAVLLPHAVQPLHQMWLHHLTQVLTIPYQLTLWPEHYHNEAGQSALDCRYMLVLILLLEKRPLKKKYFKTHTRALYFQPNSNLCNLAAYASIAISFALPVVDIVLCVCV